MFKILRNSIKSISINNNTISINGKAIEVGDEKKITIEISGDCGELEADVCHKITVNGGVKGDLTTVNGDVKCGNVGGSVSTTNGDVDAKSITGNVKTTNGDITT